MTSVRDSVPRAGGTKSFLFVKDGEAETGFFIIGPVMLLFKSLFG